jgi:hypothetical protein
MHLFLAYYTSYEQEYLFLVYFTYLWSILLMFRRFFSFDSHTKFGKIFCEIEILENGPQVAIRRMEFEVRQKL